MSEATTGVPAANASVSTMPNDSPPSDGAHSRCARLSAARFSLVVDAAEGGDSARLGQQRGQRLLLDPDHGQARGLLLAQRLEGAQQHRQPLALDGLADERDLERLARRAPARRGRAALGQRHAVGDDPVVAAEEAPAGPLRGLGHRDPHPDAVHVAARAPQPRDRVRQQVVRVGVVGGDDRREREGGRHPAGQRRHRLVQVDDVVAAAAQRAPQRGGCERRVRDVRLRAVERPPQRGTERDQRLRGAPGLTVERRDHARLVPGGAQLRRQRLDVAGHSSGVAPRVRGDERNPHPHRG